MNLIKNTLLFVVFLQLLGFLYFKFSHQEAKQNPLTKQLIPIEKRFTVKQKNLPISTQYSDSKQTPLIKIAKVLQPIKLQPVIPTIKIVEHSTPRPIKKVYIKVSKKIKLTTKLEKYAKKMLGKKYAWGATGPKTYDCSGFTQKVYRKVAGIKLPRVSYLQAKVGKKVSYKQLKQGDMVFFDTQKKRTGKVNHVGIYLKDGNFIHASSGGKKVMITNFKKKIFYKNRFLWGRRVLKEQNHMALLLSNIGKAL